MNIQIIEAKISQCQYVLDNTKEAIQEYLDDPENSKEDKWKIFRRCKALGIEEGIKQTFDLIVCDGCGREIDSRVAYIGISPYFAYCGMNCADKTEKIKYGTRTAGPR